MFGRPHDSSSPPPTGADRPARSVATPPAHAAPHPWPTSPGEKLRRPPGLGSILKALGSLLPGRARRRTALGREPAAGRVLLPWREDSLRTYPTIGLTPSRALSLLQTADAGSPAQLFELFREMLQKWPRLAAVEATRRLALTGLEWEIMPAIAPSSARPPGAVRSAGAARSDRVERDSRQPEQSSEVHTRAADLCVEALQRLDSFDAALRHLAQAIGTGVAVAELVWEDGRLIDVTPVPYSRLVCDPHEPWRLRVRTQDEPTWGVALDEQPSKWVVHCPAAQPGRPFDGGLLRASLLMFLAQNLSFKDWLIASQAAGMPVRIARYEPGTPEPDKQQILKMLEALGTDAVAAISKNVEVQMLESRRSGDGPYRDLQDYCNTEITILWLGQHLTTDMGDSGSRAAAEVHDRVREDLLVQDIADEGATIRRDVLTPMVRAVLGADAPTPRFRRALSQAIDTRALAQTLAVAVNELGMAVPADWAHRALGIPPRDGAIGAVLPGRGTR